MDSESETSARRVENQWIGDAKPVDRKTPGNALDYEKPQKFNKSLITSELRNKTKIGHFSGQKKSW